MLFHLEASKVIQRFFITTSFAKGNNTTHDQVCKHLFSFTKHYFLLDFLCFKAFCFHSSYSLSNWRRVKIFSFSSFVANDDVLLFCFLPFSHHGLPSPVKEILRCVTLKGTTKDKYLELVDNTTKRIHEDFGSLNKNRP